MFCASPMGGGMGIPASSGMKWYETIAPTLRQPPVKGQA